MNKTTVRIVGVGATLLLGALALALAQHDARQSSESELVLAKPPAEPPKLIPVDESPLWGRDMASSKTIVRANDDPPAMPPSLEYPMEDDNSPPAPLPQAAVSDNPLRKVNDGASTNAHGQAPALEQYSESANIQLVSGEGPPKSGTSDAPAMPPMPSTAPATTPVLPAAPIPALTSPPGAAGDANRGDVIRAPRPGWTQAPPSLPSTGAPAPINGANSVRPSTSQSLSDTQMPAMPVTNLTAPPNLNGPSSSNLQPPPTLTPAANTPRNNGQLITAPLSNNPPGALGSPTANNPPSLSAGNGSGSVPSLGGPPPAATATLGSPVPTGPTASSSGYSIPNGINASGGSEPARSSFSGTPFAGTLLGRLISNQPGNSALDGSQNPVMLIQKRVASECQVGKKATVIITVRNAGNSTAQDVEVIDSVPNGASFAEAMPTVTPTQEGILVWKLGEMAPNDERTITLQIIPERQGELGSTAVVRFAAQASMRTVATLPKLELTYHAQPEVLIGNTYSIEVNVRNTGTGVARGVKLHADIPTNLRHESGETVLESKPLGDLAPGESRNIELKAMAVEPGASTVALKALTDDGVQQEQRAELRVMAPALEAVITGPNRRYLDRVATFQIMIKNTGSAAATNCEFTMRLPAGLNFNVASQHGSYNSEQHAVMWSVPEWPAGHAEAIELTVLPVEIGQQQLIFQAEADLGVKTEARGSLTVEEQGELTFTIDQDADPIELSASTTYTVEVRNVGRPDRDVELSLQLPPGSEVLKVDAPVKAAVIGDTLRFDPIPQMDGRASQKFRIEVRHGKVGTQKVSAQLRSQNRPTLVIKEEATEVYNDRE